MLEIPEAVVISTQLNNTIRGRRISDIVAADSPHKFAFFHEEPEKYYDLLFGKVIGGAHAYGGLVEIEAEDSRILFGDGVRIRFHDKDEKRPKKHQLLIEFDDGTALSGSVQMYGGLWCFKEGTNDNPYYLVAKEKPLPLSDEFNSTYFDQLISSEEIQKKSAKAFLATEQRIPGLGNGSLQDILYNAGIHPKRKIKSLSEAEKSAIFDSIKTTFEEIIAAGGRDTERDLFDEKGGYQTKVSRFTVGEPCDECGTEIKKSSYMGGSIYYCEGCQKL